MQSLSRMKINYLPSLILLIFITACKKECTESMIEFTDLETEYNCTNTKNTIEVDLTNQFTIIKDQSTFEDRISGPCIPNIDFEMYDLLIGKFGLTSGNNSIDYELKTSCESDDLILNVIFNQGLTTVAPNLSYHILMPKLAQEQNVEVNISIVQ